MATRALGGLLNRRERWGLSWLGWLVLICLPLALAVWIFFTIEPFLSVTARVPAQVLVMEGWIPHYAIRATAEEFRAGSYEKVFTTGGPITGMGGYTNDYNTAANLGAGRLRVEGLPADLVQMVPSRESGKDRTYASAVALREWFRENGVAVRSFNIVTENAHARRTRMLFEKAFGKDWKIGVIAVANPDYPARDWWRYSEGVRDVLGETIAYLYARLVFH